MRTRSVAATLILLSWLGVAGPLSNSNAANTRPDIPSSRVHRDRSAGARRFSSPPAAVPGDVHCHPGKARRRRSSWPRKIWPPCWGRSAAHVPGHFLDDGGRRHHRRHASDFPGLNLTKALEVVAPEDRNHYILKTERERILCIGASESGPATPSIISCTGSGAAGTSRSELGVGPRKRRSESAADIEERPDYFGFMSPAQAWGGGDWNRRNRNHESPDI